MADLCRILILGASGQFGSLLCHRLIQLRGLQLFLGGRGQKNLEELQRRLFAANSGARTYLLNCDINVQHLAEMLSARKLNLVIHLAGPFQAQDFRVAKACLEAGVNYIDMSDGRTFVANFASLDAAARARQVSLVSGASTVPGLSSAIIDAALKRCSNIEAIDYGIAAGLKTGLGLATLRAVLSYCGKPYEVLRDGKRETIYGLGRSRQHDFPKPVGRRAIVDCDIPDHSLFPERYPALKRMDFGSCIDAPGLAQILPAMSEYTRRGKVGDWDFLSFLIRPCMNILKPFGSAHSGFFMRLEGRDGQGAPKNMLFEILARNGSGLEIPVTPVVLLVKRLLKGETLPSGAYPCMGLFSLAEFQEELSSYPISWEWKDVP